MLRKFPVFIILILVSGLFINSFSYASTTLSQDFIDVPKNSWAYEDVHRLRELNITYGIGGNRFGFGQTISRGEFLTFLVRLMGWDIIKPEKGSFLDNMDPTHNFYGTIETALLHGVITKDSDYFRTDDAITREEIAIMIVRTLGYDTLAKQLNSLEKPFEDIVRHFGYITIGKDLGIIAGDGINFYPNDKATREQAAAMMMRMYNKLTAPLEELHAFYAISSLSQIDKFPDFDSVSFGWARIEYDETSDKVFVNTNGGSNEYYIPTGFSQVIEKAENSNLTRQLMFFIRDQDVYNAETEKNLKLTEYIILNPEVRKQIIKEMVSLVNHTEKHGSTVEFDGLVADFEGLRGKEISQAYNLFLSELKEELAKTQKSLYVAVHPKRKPGQAYYDGYDYRTIGEIADKVILMAHDYAATSLTDTDMNKGYTDTPVTPFDDIYYALKSITDPVSGVKDTDKIWLQLSMDAVQWKLIDGKVINRYPYRPTYEQLYNRFLTGVSLNYSLFSQNPYAIFASEEGARNIIWYENQQSIAAKIKLAKLFGIKGLSLWRLGNIPDYADTPQMELQLNIWKEIINNY
ncbi:MAG: hypothetical protein GX957_06340 [Clostridiaceae bacterium]|nr:hypothetical protein [Clostridiaceae bacterium]